MASAAGETEETTRLRKPRFSFEENQILIREVRAHYPQLYGAQSRRVNVAERRRVWDGIAAKINGVTSWKRTGQEVQKRWNDFKRRTKEKLARVPHSTQGSGPAAEDAFSGEEETIFAILGLGVAGAGAELSLSAAPSQPPAPSAPEDRREERRADTAAHSKAASGSPQPWPRASCKPQEGGCLPLKERESSPPPVLQTVQLSPLALSPPPQPVQVAASCPSPPPPPLPPPVPLAPDPSLDFLRAQQETANAIRELAGTLRQGLTKLSEALSALLPLLPGTPVDPLGPPAPPDAPAPVPAQPVLPAPAPKVEMTPEPVSEVAAVVDGAMVDGAAKRVITPQSQKGAPQPPPVLVPPLESPPHKRRKGFPTRKRRGRWKTP